MLIEMMSGKIHRATVTEANLQYMGSITIDKTLLDAADFLRGQKVQIVNNNNGARFETYVMVGEKDSGIICLNGAAARLASPGDQIIIIGYVLLEKEEAKIFENKIIFVDENNKII